VSTAREQAQRALVAAAAAGSSGYQAFATYAAGEVALLEDPQTGISLLRAAAAQAGRAGATQVITVARIALAAALTRLGRHGEALVLFPALLDQARREGNWPQLWTSLRILAELLASLDRHEIAALLLTAAREAPSAPAVSGPDVDRHRLLDDLIRQRLEPDVLHQITTLARALPRAQVADRALAAIDGLNARTAPRLGTSVPSDPDARATHQLTESAGRSCSGVPVALGDNRRSRPSREFHLICAGTVPSVRPVGGTQDWSFCSLCLRSS